MWFDSSRPARWRRRARPSGRPCSCRPSTPAGRCGSPVGVDELWAANLARLTDEFRRPLVRRRPAAVAVHRPVPRASAVEPASPICREPSNRPQAATAADHRRKPVRPRRDRPLLLRRRRRLPHAARRRPARSTRSSTWSATTSRHRDRRPGRPPSTGLLRAVAAETGRRGVVITTNLRRHPLLKATPWLRAFGGPLAAVGHLLGPRPAGSCSRATALASSTPRSARGPRPIRSTARPGSPSSTLPTPSRGSTRSRGSPLSRWCSGTSASAGRTWAAGSTAAAARSASARCSPSMPAARSAGFRVSTTAAASSRRSTTCAAVDGVVDPSTATCSPAVSRPGRPRRSVDFSDESEAAQGFRSAARARMRKAARPRLRGARERPPAIACFRPPPSPRSASRSSAIAWATSARRATSATSSSKSAMVQLFAEYGICWRLVSPDSARRHRRPRPAGLRRRRQHGQRYPGNYALRTQALATGLPVVILPQSFTSPEHRPFATVFVRERGSLALRPDGVLAPDLALGLATAEPPRPSRDPRGVSSPRSGTGRASKPLAGPRSRSGSSATPFAYLALAARYRRIVTDRLHFAIAGLHAGREVTLVANDYHKNRSMHETWLADLGCRFASSPAAALSRLPSRRCDLPA